jgi:single-strand DNA-binding protein
MSDTNKVLIVGRLTRNPELRYTPSGTAVCDLSVANNRYYNDKQFTTFVRVTTWDKQAEFLGNPEKGVKTGDKVLIEGSLVDDNYETTKGDPSTKTAGRLKIDRARVEVLQRKQTQPESDS